MTGLCALFWIAVVTLAWIGCNLLGNKYDAEERGDAGDGEVSRG